MKTLMNNVTDGFYENQVGSLSNEGGSIGSFFKHLGKSIKHGVTDIGKDVGHTLLNQAKDTVTNGVNFAIQNPALATTALLGTGLHDRLFEKHLMMELKKHEKNGGGLSGGSFLKIAKRAFDKSKQIAQKELSNQVQNI
jgi:hypothetical protein